MRIKNTNGTEQKTCECGSWFEHWKRFGRRPTPTFCAVENCYGRDLVGAHVQKGGSSDESWFVVSLCSAHNNQRDGALTISDPWKLVSANVSLTCGK